MRRSIETLTLLLISIFMLTGCSAPRPAVGRTQDSALRGVVAADHQLASVAGAEMLRRGGNAVDAAVASSFALSVVRPNSCGIGGGGFMVIHLREHPGLEPGSEPLNVALNYRETCPSGVGPGYYESPGIRNDPRASVDGGRAVAVPGSVAGLLYALDHYGTLDRATVLGPAIRIAREGWTIDAHHEGTARRIGAWIEQSESRRTRFGFVWDRLTGRGEIRQGDTITNPEQAVALELIAEMGADAFYRGPIGDAIVEAVRNDGGALSREDLLAYHVDVTEPVRTEWRGRELLCMPPPSSGGIAIAQLFGLVDRLGTTIPPTGWASPLDTHLLIETMKHAFADRARHLADPRFVDLPIDQMLSPSNLDLTASRITHETTHDPASYGIAPIPPEDGGTSHISVVDRFGNAVACTETINTAFGSKLVVDAYGFALNNEMDDFTTVRGATNAYGLTQSDANLPSPGKRPLSSMSPTIVLDENRRVEAVAGASGGPRIITATAQSLLRVLLADASASEAVGAPRVHHQWQPDAVYTETWSGTRVPDDLLAGLNNLGHAHKTRKEIGVCQLIRRSDGGGWDAASDPRKGGSPAWE